MNTIKLVKFYKGVDGLKTGYTDEAGSSIAVTAKKDGLRLIAISFGYKDTKTRNSEMIALLDYGFKQYNSKTLISKDKAVKQISLPKADKDKIDLFVKEDVKVTNKIGENPKKYTYNIELKDIDFPVKKGDALGSLYLKNNGEVVREVLLITDTDIRKAGIFKQYFKVLKDMVSGTVI